MLFEIEFSRCWQLFKCFILDWDLVRKECIPEYVKGLRLKLLIDVLNYFVCGDGLRAGESLEEGWYAEEVVTVSMGYVDVC